MRGNERKKIFRNSNDKERFLLGIEEKKKKATFLLHAYCLMDNHVHLLLNIKQDDLGEIMKSIGVRYASFYNWKHNRVGHVFQDRFKSEPIEDDRYLLAVVRYIHNNPVKACIVKNPADYRWSSYSNYMQSAGAYCLDVSLVLRLFSNNQRTAVEEFEKFSMHADHTTFLDIEDESSIRTLEEGRTYLEKYLANNAIAKEIAQIKQDKNCSMKLSVICGQKLPYPSESLRNCLGLTKARLSVTNNAGKRTVPVPGMEHEVSRIWNWIIVCICLTGIMHFSQQQFNQQDISPFIEQSERLVQAVQNLPPIEFSYHNRVINSHQDTVAFIQFVIRKLAHVTIYGIFGLSLLLATRPILKNQPIRWIIVGMLVLLTAVLDETNQLYSSGRTGCREDILLDFSGYVLFSLIYFMTCATKKLLKS